MKDVIYQDIVNNTFEGVIVISDDYRIKFMNRFAREITGFSNKEAKDRFCYEVLKAKCCKNNCPIKTLKEGKKLGEIFVDIIARDNSEKFIKTKVIPSHGCWVEIFQDVTREKELEKRVKEKYIFGDIITQDKRLIDILKEFPQIAAGNVPVLFQGDSGVGKEVFSSALQALSERRDKPFVKINCASLPDTLLESELFGYKKGAFTDARKDKPGLFVTAHQGTLLLDEIGEMSLPLQAKLLRAVETGEIIPLGATKPEKIDARIMAATNKDLNNEVEKGNFREDLFYRLNVVNIKIPPLRERKGDISLFIDYFIHHFNIIQEKQVTGVSPGALAVLLNHHYPGNVRELRNIMEYVFIFCNEGEVLEKHLPEYLRAAEKTQPLPVPIEPPDMGEKERLLEALGSARWNKKKAAEILGIDRTTLWRKMKKYGIR
ncbi:MAG: Fis family transcriptional regulator [bacterium]|nr:Fis family transcriptional regulator [bacterium]